MKLTTKHTKIFMEIKTIKTSVVSVISVVNKKKREYYEN